MERGNWRFNWNTPIHISPNEKGTIYIGAQFSSVPAITVNRGSASRGSHYQ